MIRSLALMLLLVGCAEPEVLPLPPPEPPPAPAEPVASPPATTVAPAIRAALERAAPRESALVAAPSADADSIALVRTLHRNVEHALADLERDGGRHVTPDAVKRARTAVKDLQNHLDEFHAAKDAP
jgi:hypothetical protein